MKTMKRISKTFIPFTMLLIGMVIGISYMDGVASDRSNDITIIKIEKKPNYFVSIDLEMEE